MSFAPVKQMAPVCFHADNTCGDSRGKSSLSRLVDCKDDIRNHLANYRLSNVVLSEYEVILARAGKFELTEEDVSNLWVCPQHRYALGKYWVPSKKTCISPCHTGQLKALTGRDVVSYDMGKWMKKLYGCNVQLGPGIKITTQTNRIHVNMYLFCSS